MQIMTEFYRVCPNVQCCLVGAYDGKRTHYLLQLPLPTTPILCIFCPLKEIPSTVIHKTEIKTFQSSFFQVNY